MRSHRIALPVAILLVHGGREAILAVPMVYSTICNNWEINPKYEKVLS